MATDDFGPEPNGSFTEEPREFVDPPNNHLSPMGQVDAIGDFARGLGRERLTRIFVTVIAVGIVALMIALIVVP